MRILFVSAQGKNIFLGSAAGLQFDLMNDSEKDLALFCALNRKYGYRTRRIIEKLDRDGIFEQLLPESGDRALFDNPEIDRWGYREVERCKTEGISLIPYTDSRYPPLLKECCDAPILLYVKGEIPEGEMLSVVGTRRPDAYGLSICRTIINEIHFLEKPPSIVSGLAFGIDREAHLSTMDAKGRTIAVMATGADIIYPYTHRRIAERILDNGGCLISDFPLGTVPVAVNFLRRNRIIAGISSATAVIQSPRKGGSMVTANEAFSYGRDLYAVPGRIGDRLSEGCNYLIASQMAECILSPGQFAERFGQRMPGKGSLFLEGNKAEILKAISGNGNMCDTDYLLSHSGIGIQELLAGLTELEAEGIIFRPDGINWKMARSLP